MGGVSPPLILFYLIENRYMKYKSLLTDINDVKSWSDELGDYPTNSWLGYSPDYPYSPASKNGCLIYVKTYPADNKMRFIVGEDFRYTYETEA